MWPSPRPFRSERTTIANSASTLSGSATARTTPSVSSRAVGPRAHGDERHLARVVDLRQPRQLAARQLAARARRSAGAGPRGASCSTKARCCASSSGRIGRSTIASPCQSIGLRQLGGIGRDREAGGAGRPGRARRARARRARSRRRRRPSSGLMSSSASSRQVGQHLRQRDQHVADRIEPRRRMVAVAGQQAGDAGARDELAGQRRGSAAAARSPGRRSPRPRCRPGRTAAPGRTPGRRWRRRSAPARSGRRTIGCTVKPVDAAPAAARRATRASICGGGACAARSSSRRSRRDAADIGLVADVGREDLQRDRKAELARRRGRRGGRRRRRRRVAHDRDAVGLQHRLGLGFAEHRRGPSASAASTIARAAAVRGGAFSLAAGASSSSSWLRR